MGQEGSTESTNRDKNQLASAMSPSLELDEDITLYQVIGAVAHRRRRFDRPRKRQVDSLN